MSIGITSLGLYGGVSETKIVTAELPMVFTVGAEAPLIFTIDEPTIVFTACECD